MQLISKNFMAFWTFFMSGSTDSMKFVTSTGNVAPNKFRATSALTTNGLNLARATGSCRRGDQLAAKFRKLEAGGFLAKHVKTGM